MQEKIIKSISPIPLGLTLGIVSAIISLIITVIMGIFLFPALLNLPSLPENVSLYGFSSLFGIIALVVMPFVAFGAGFIQGLLIAVIYNFIASRIGGIKVRFGEKSSL